MAILKQHLEHMQLSTAIESFLYGDLGVQGVTALSIQGGLVRLSLAPWEGPRVVTIALFREARLMSVETYADTADDLEMPYDVIGFDSYPMEDGRWRFGLHCSAIEWCFESAWPSVERVLLSPSDG